MAIFNSKLLVYQRVHGAIPDDLFHCQGLLSGRFFTDVPVCLSEIHLYRTTVCHVRMISMLIPAGRRLRFSASAGIRYS